MSANTANLEKTARFGELSANPPSFLSTADDVKQWRQLDAELDAICAERDAIYGPTIKLRRAQRYEQLRRATAQFRQWRAEQAANDDCDSLSTSSSTSTLSIVNPSEIYPDKPKLERNNAHVLLIDGETPHIFQYAYGFNTPNATQQQNCIEEQILAACEAAEHATSPVCA